jgi:hypothetical protein
MAMASPFFQILNAATINIMDKKTKAGSKPKPGSVADTTYKNDPVKGDHTDTVIHRLSLTSTNRQPKDAGSFRRALILAESVYSPNESELFDLYEDVLLDAVVSGMIRKRISQVVNKKLLFLVNGKEVPIMQKTLKSKVFKNIMRQIIWAKMWGVNGLEFIPGEKISFELIPKKHIKRKTQLISFTQSTLTEGIPYTDVANWWILGEPKDLGLLLICGFLTLLKKGVISDWAQYIEIFGSPAIVLKYKGYNSQAQAQADKILKNIGNSMRMAIPEEMNLTFEDGKVANGDGKLHDAFRQACIEELSIAILGNTETTGHAKTGTGAKSETHANQQMELIKDDMDDICDELNSDHFMNILRSYNLPVDGGEFIFDSEVDMKTLAAKYPIDMAWHNAGLKIPVNYIRETYSIPEAKDGEEVLELRRDQTEPETPPPPKPKPAPKKKITAQLSDDAPATIGNVKALFADFFGPARS